ncbi:MAG: SH3 domain-containing protein [Anaerolineae bacterium]|nr:SH3 domain-containing protein [Anaerolineae bacterium]
MLRRVVFIVCILAAVVLVPSAFAQEVVTSTPARVVIPTQAPEELQQQIGITATWTRTPTVVGPASLEAKVDAGEVNVRAEPDINSEKLGTIRNGDLYVVLGKRFRWYQFQFDTSPTGRAWVFDELVDIIGDESAIVSLDPDAIATIDPVILAQTQTQQAITQTPGALLTATADARILPAPDAQGEVIFEGEDGEGQPIVALPTFTYPPDSMLFAVSPTPEAGGITTANPNMLPIPLPEDIPPITPVLVLGGLGLLGLAVSSLRR